MLSIVFSVMDFFISELKKKHVNFYGVLWLQNQDIIHSWSIFVKYIC